MLLTLETFFSGRDQPGCLPASGSDNDIVCLYDADVTSPKMTSSRDAASRDSFSQIRQLREQL